MKKIFYLLIIILCCISSSEAVKIDLNTGKIVEEKKKEHKILETGFELFHAKKYTDAMIAWKKDVEAGEGSAATMIGFLYSHGYEGITKNPAKALEWYQKALKMGDEFANFSLSVLYVQGDEPIKQDLKKAYEYIHKIENLEDDEVKIWVYQFYLYGWGTPKNIDKATKIAQKIKDAKEKEEALQTIEKVKTTPNLTYNPIMTWEQQPDEEDEDDEEDDSKYSKEVRKKRMWAFEHINIGTKWNLQEMVRRFGDYEQYDPERWNPKIIQMFYFPEIDMTFMVNLLEGEVATWRTGKEYR